MKQIFKEFEFTFVCGYGSVNFNMHIGSCNKHCKQDIEEPQHPQRIPSFWPFIDKPSHEFGK